MTSIYLIVALYALVFTLLYYSSAKPSLKNPQKSNPKTLTVIILLVCSFILRVVISASIVGHSTDINCFKSWADMAYNDGLSNFYTSDVFTDYPPGYIYVLWLIGAIKYVFNIADLSAIHLVLLKLPAIICDLVTGWFLFDLLKKRVNTTLASCTAFLYLFNPAIVINSSAWGQVDSIFTLFVVLFIYCICERKLLPACIFYAIGFVIKPQTVIFTPVLLLYLYKILFIEKPNGEDFKKVIKEIAISAGASIALIFVLILPFAKNFDFMPIINQYISTLASYPYASVNAYNIFALFGGIWRDANHSFMLLSYSAWSNIAILAIVFVSAYLYIKNKGETNLFLLGAFIITAMFTCAAKMHERYVFPALILLLCAFAYKKDRRIFGVFILLSIGQFLNTGVVFYNDILTRAGETVMASSAIVPIICLINIFTFIYLAYVLFTHRASDDVVQRKKSFINKLVKNNAAEGFELMASKPPMRITRIDVIIMVVVTLLYSVVAFFDLGDMKAPVTQWNSTEINEGFQIEFDEGTYIEKVKWFTGPYEERGFNVTTLYSDKTATRETKTMGAVFRWNEFFIGGEVDALQFVSAIKNISIMEMAFVTQDGTIIKPKAITALGKDCGIDALMDEQDLVPQISSHKNGTYFDEIYHARTAYEHIHSLIPYETTHPPLGKILISIGILIFGMNPFGWRVVGTLFGVLMLPCIYIFSKKLFNRTSIAFLAIMLMATDFMHFTQTRIATIDVYITFFIILMYYFMYDYTTKSFYDTPFKKTLIPLGLSGLFMGLGIATKWTGVYAGIGLAIMFFISFGKRIYEYKKVMSDPHSSKGQRRMVSVCKKYCTQTILWCMLFFVVIPLVIYLLSYIPVIKAPNLNGINSIIANQFSMFEYHSKLTDSHPFSSFWYQWPIISRPIWYSDTVFSETTRSTIAAFGNPFIWWLGIGAALYCVYKMFKEKSYSAMFLVIGYLAQYVPWMSVTRVVFIYHYFTCVPFVVLMLAYVFNDVLVRYPYRSLTLKNNNGAIMICIYCIICLLAFISFYPVLSGMEVSKTYIDSLRWYSSWTF